MLGNSAGEAVMAGISSHGFSLFGGGMGPIACKKGQAPLHTFEDSASGILASVQLTEARHKTILRFKSWRRRLHLLTGEVAKSHCKRPCILGTNMRPLPLHFATPIHPWRPAEGRLTRGRY